MANERRFAISRRLLPRILSSRKMARLTSCESARFAGVANRERCFERGEEERFKEVLDA